MKEISKGNMTIGIGLSKEDKYSDLENGVQIYLSDSYVGFPIDLDKESAIKFRNWLDELINTLD